MGGIRIVGADPTGGVVEVDTSHNAYVKLPDASEPDLTGSMILLSDVDAGTITGSPYRLSPETDDDYRVRVGTENCLDQEVFRYSAQNTGKHNVQTTTMTMAWANTGMKTNSGGSTTTGQGLSFNTQQTFSLLDTLHLTTRVAFSAQPVTNTTLDFGFFIPGSSQPYTPGDGIFFRLTSAGIRAVSSFNGSETLSSLFSFSYSNGVNYLYEIQVAVDHVHFLIDGILYVSLSVGTSNVLASAGIPFSIRHDITGGSASGALSATFSNYAVCMSGPALFQDLGNMGSSFQGTYQGLAGGTMGSLATYPNNTDPTPGIPSNTAANLGTGLGGQVFETESNTFALTTDGIILSYRIPLGTVSVPGRRLRLTGVQINSYVQTVVVGGPYIAQWSLAFGNYAATATLATAEAANAKAPRRIALGHQLVALNAAVLTPLASLSYTFVNPIYVNPGEYIAVVKKKIGTIATSGAIAHVIAYDYTWE